MAFEGLIMLMPEESRQRLLHVALHGPLVMEAEPSRQMPTEAATGSECQTAEAENGRPTWPDIARIFEVDCPRHLIPQSTKQLSTLAARKRPVQASVTTLTQSHL